MQVSSGLDTTCQLRAPQTQPLQVGVEKIKEPREFTRECCTCCLQCCTCSIRCISQRGCCIHREGLLHRIKSDVHTCICAGMPTCMQNHVAAPPPSLLLPLYLSIRSLSLSLFLLLDSILVYIAVDVHPLSFPLFLLLYYILYYSVQLSMSI